MLIKRRLSGSDVRLHTHHRLWDVSDEEGGRLMTAAELLCICPVSSGSKLGLPEAGDLWNAVEAWG